jgi:hypothetical protein
MQALRLDAYAARSLANSSLIGISSMCHSLRQLALVGLLHVSDASVMATLQQLPMLQVHYTARVLDGRDVCRAASASTSSKDSHAAVGCHLYQL